MSGFYVYLELETGGKMFTLRLEYAVSLVYLYAFHMPLYPFQGVLSQNPRCMSLPSMVNSLQANPPLSDLAYFTA